MSATLRPVLDMEIRVAVSDEVRYAVACFDCTWLPLEMHDEATARIMAYEHNAEKHPDAVVTVTTPQEDHRQHDEFLQRRVRVSLVLLIGAGILFVAMMLLLEAPFATSIFIGAVLGNVAVHAKYLGHWQARLQDHRTRPPGAIMVGPPPSEPEP